MTNPDHVAQVRIFNNDRSLLDGAGGEDSHLRLVDHGRAHDRSERADVGDGERSAGELIRLQLLVACAIRQVVRGACEPGHILLAGKSNHGSDEPRASDRDSNSDVQVFLDDDALLLDGCIQNRVFAQRLDGCLNEERRERELDAFPFEEFLLMLLAEMDEVRHVRFGE